MKKIKLFVLLMMCVAAGFAQIHTDPNNGYIGIGNTSPIAPLHISGGAVMTHGWSRTSLLQANYPVMVFNSANNKYGGIGYDYSSAMCFWVNAPTEDVAVLPPSMSILNDGHVIIGTGGISNPQGWNKVLQVNGNQHAKLLVTENSGVKLGMYAHTGYNAKIGTESNDNLTFTAGYWNDVMTLTTAGNVGVGTLTPNEKLTVNGKIRAKEIKVETANFPDYVFEDDYRLSTLTDLEKYIQIHKHLPEIPTAKQVEAAGLELGEMNKLLLKKVEELTLYMIQKDKEVIDLRIQNKLLNDKMDVILKKIK